MDEIPLITARIAALLGDAAGEAFPLDGGITNRNYKVAFGDEVVAHYLNNAHVELEAFDAAVTDWERYRSFERM